MSTQGKKSGGQLLRAFARKHRKGLDAIPKDKGGLPKQEELRNFLMQPERLAELALIVGVVLVGVYLEAEKAPGAAAPKGGAS